MTNFWLSLGFIAFSIIGNKRGFIFYLPVILFFVGWQIRHQIRGYFKYVAWAILCLMLAFYLVPRILPSLNPEHKVWGEFDINHIVTYVTKYNTASERGKTTGRVSSTVTTYNYLAESDATVTFFGRGPGTVMKSFFEKYDRRYLSQMETLGIKYGMTGLNWLSLQVGYLGTVIWFCFYLYVYSRLKLFFENEYHPYWRAFNLGMLNFTVVALIMSLTYNIVLITHDTFSMVFFLLLAFAIKRNEILVRNKNTLK
jgi:hypothetical protein